MSNAVFPDLVGMDWPVELIPRFSTKVAEAISLKEQRARYSAYPVYTIGLVYSVMEKADFLQLAGFFLARSGRFDSFLFNNVDDNSVIDQSIGIGNGTTTQFQLLRALGGYIEPVMNVNGTAVIKKNGTTQVLGTHYTLSAKGLVTFVTAPANGDLITWSGAYYWRCRFKDDTTKLEKFMAHLWQNKKIELIGSVGNKV